MNTFEEQSIEMLQRIQFVIFGLLITPLVTVIAIGLIFIAKCPFQWWMVENLWISLQVAWNLTTIGFVGHG